MDIHHGLTYYVFDIPIASPDFPFSRRWNRLVKLSGQKWPGEIKLVTTWVARSESVVEFILQMCLQEGFEGIMLRDPTSVYTFSRTSALLKYKTWVDDEGIVVDWVEGEGKHVGRLGSLLVQGRGWSSWVGTGFSDTEREKLWAMRTRLKGLIVTVKYQQVTEDQHLRFPRFKRVRKDL